MLQTLHLEQPENYNSCYDRSPHSCKSLWKNPEGLLPCDYREMLINIKKLIFFLIKVAKNQTWQALFLKHNITPQVQKWRIKNSSHTEYLSVFQMADPQNSKLIY